MASVQWSDLPADILSPIAKRFKSDVDLLRFRSVCSLWRSSHPAPRKPFSFPLNVPPLLSDSHYVNGYFTLNQNTCYRVSPPAARALAGDPSNGWLFMASETNPNTFSLIDSLTKVKDSPVESKPKHLNLLDHRVSEICKSHMVSFFNNKGSYSQDPFCNVYKVIALWNFVPDCDFAALVMRFWGLSLWKFGDECWTAIDRKGYDLLDLIIYDSKCYAVDAKGSLFSFDSGLNLTTVADPPPRGDHGVRRKHLVEFESDLYMVSKTSWDGVHNDLKLKVKLYKYNNCKFSWDSIEDSEGMVFVVCDDVSFCVSPKDFGGCKGNAVYLTYIDYIMGEIGVYHLDDGRTFELTMAEDCVVNCFGLLLVTFMLNLSCFNSK